MDSYVLICLGRNFVLWEKLVLKRTIWNLRVLFCTTRVRLLVPMFEMDSVFDD